MCPKAAGCRENNLDLLGSGMSWVTRGLIEAVTILRLVEVVLFEELRLKELLEGR